MPASSVDHVAHATALEYRSGVGAPRAPEVVRASSDRVPGGGGDSALVDDVVAGVVGRATRGRDGTIGSREDTDVDLIEPSLGCLTEDEVNGTLDVRLRVQLCTSLGEYCVLVSEECATVVALLSCVGGESQSLGALAVGVFHIYVILQDTDISC